MSRFKSVVYTLGAIFLICGLAYGAPVRTYPARPTLDFKFPGNVAKSWVNFATDSLVTNVAPKVLSDTVYTAIRVNQDTLRIIGTSAGDSTYVVLYGTTASDSLNSNLVEERLRVSGLDTVYATKRYASFEMASADTESATSIQIIAKRYGYVASIQKGKLTSQAAIHFTGSRSGGITAWNVAIDTTTQAGVPNAVIRCELRVYPDFKDVSATPATGYYVADRSNLSVGTVTATVNASASGRTGGRSFVSDWGKPLLIPPHAAVGIYAVASHGDITTARVSGSLVGYDSNP